MALAHDARATRRLTTCTELYRAPRASDGAGCRAGSRVTGGRLARPAAAKPRCAGRTGRRAAGRACVLYYDDIARRSLAWCCRYNRYTEQCLLPPAPPGTEGIREHVSRMVSDCCVLTREHRSHSVCHQLLLSSDERYSLRTERRDRADLTARHSLHQSAVETRVATTPSASSSTDTVHDSTQSTQLLLAFSSPAAAPLA